MSAFFVANSGIDVHRATQPIMQCVMLLAFGLLVTACAQQPPTASSGRHSPWHWQTYFYDRKRKTFKEVDDFTGPVIKRNFKLSAPDWIEVQVQGTTGDPSDINTGHSVKRRLSTMN